MAKKKIVTEDPKYRYFVRPNLFDGSPQIYKVDRKTKKVTRLLYSDDSFVETSFTLKDLTDKAYTAIMEI